MYFYRNYYGPDCLAPYGGPVDPAIAYGGFLEKGQTLESKPAYEKAKAVILTFLVNNFNEKGKIQAALKWEKRYINHMATSI